MDYVCIAAVGEARPGDVVTVPDGAALSPVHWARVAVSDSKPPAAQEDAEAPASPGAFSVAAPVAGSADPPSDAGSQL